MSYVQLLQLLKQLAALIMLAVGAGACAQVPAPGNPSPSPAQPPASASTQTAKLLPSQDRQLLIIGQDMGSVSAYVDSGKFPPPGGVTTYLAFYQLLNSNHPAHGALGEDRYGEPTGFDVDWGAG